VEAGCELVTKGLHIKGPQVHINQTVTVQVNASDWQTVWPELESASLNLSMPAPVKSVLEQARRQLKEGEAMDVWSIVAVVVAGTAVLVVSAFFLYFFIKFKAAQVQNGAAVENSDISQ